MKKYLFTAEKIWFILLLVILNPELYAQQANPDLIGVLSMEELKQVAPHMPVLTEAGDVESYLEANRQWALQYPEEFAAYRDHPKVKTAGGVAWQSYGIDYTEEEKAFPHSWWEWFVASGITEERVKELFPHFPRPVLTGDKEKDLANYDLQLLYWSRLYPKEYEAFINAPELAALNPYYTGYYKFGYYPDFIAVMIGSEMPVKEDTGDPITDEYNYQRKLRNWYFIYEPETFEKLYGGDYDFPEDFDAEHYRKTFREFIEATEKGEPYPPLDEAYQNQQDDKSEFKFNYKYQKQQ